MKILVAVPCMDMMHTQFVASLIALKMGDEYEVRFGASSLIYDTRNSFIKYALDNDFDRLIQIDSDMKFEPYTLALLNEDLDRGLGIVTGLCFKRKPPFSPAIFDECDIKHTEDGKIEAIAHCYYDYPIDSIFEVGACGGAFVGLDMTTVKEIISQYGRHLYMPAAGFGEDLSFCMRARAAGKHIYCDSRIKVGHVGDYVYDEAMYDREKLDKEDRDGKHSTD